jgi:outer membrane protein assembly factor BamB
MTFMSRFCLAVVLFLSTALSVAAENWPEFRGPYANGHSSAKGLPTHWSETDNIRWKVPIPGKAWSSPVVWGDQIWVTNATEKGHQLSTLAFDRRTGATIHNIVVFEIEKPQFCFDYNSYASSTPVIEEGRIYVHYGSHGTACLDTATGKTLWTRQDLKCDHHRGAGSSPILYKDLLFIIFDGFDQQYVVALDKATGKTVWKKNREAPYRSDNGDFKKAYATPTIVDVNGRTVIVCPSAMATFAYDPLTGDERWRVVHGCMNAAGRPLFGLGKVFVSIGDGTSRDDNFNLFAVRPEGEGDLTTHLEWKYSRSVPSRASFLLIGERLYMIHEKSGLLSCLDAQTGKAVWSERLKGSFTPSPLYADGHIYCCNEEGQTYVIEPGDSLKVLATNSLAAGCMASPIAVDRSLFIRTKTHLYCIEGK